MRDRLPSEADYWRFRPQLVAALDPAFYPPDWLDWMVHTGRIHVLAGDASAVLFSLRTYPTGARELHGEMACGPLDEITERLIPQALDAGRTNGCAIATIESRDGWSRVMKACGWRHYQTTLQMAL